MRPGTNRTKSEDQDRSKQQHVDKHKNRSVSPPSSHHSNQRRVSVSDDDDDVSHTYTTKPEMSQIQEDHEEENENYDEEGEEYVSDTDYMVQWTGPRKNLPVVLFRADAILEKESSAKCVGEKYRLAFKIVRTECKIVRSVLVSHGFHEVHPNSLEFNVMWTGSHIKPYVLRGFSEFQKVNHFPRSYELTRKDRLCKNVQRMQHLKGFKHFDFIPLTFITPIEFGDFQSTFTKEKGVWIVKPVASSRGRGIFLINHPSQVPMDETLIVSRYINNPLLIDDFKFDIRLYVLVTSYDPLIIYLYEEGLARFASQKFDKSTKSVKNQFMHLTNYSVNKRNPDFVKNADPELEDYGNKWSMSAMLRYLKSVGFDTAALMVKIEDLIVKTFLAGEMAIASASNMFQPFRGNCFELYGFDVLVDENMKPWLMEVNLSPSLACDAPIDLKIKANMVSDLFSVVGVTAQDPVSRRMQNRRNEALTRNGVRQQRQRAANGATKARGGGGAPFTAAAKKGSKGSSDPNATPLTNEEAKILRMAKEEYGRRGRWIRIFPTQTSWENYGSLMEHRTTHNLMLYSKLYPNGRTKAGTGAPSRPSSGYPSTSNRPRSAAPAYNTDVGETGPASGAASSAFSCEIIGRLLQYERRLMTLAESRAVSAANGNRRVNSESVALSLSNTNSMDVPPVNAHSMANGMRVGSASHDKSGRSRSQQSVGVESGSGTKNSNSKKQPPSSKLTGKESSRSQHKSGSAGTKSTGQNTGEDGVFKSTKSCTTVDTSEKATEPMQSRDTRHLHRRQQEITVYNASVDYTRSVSHSRSRSASSSQSRSRSASHSSGGSRSQSRSSAASSSSFDSDNNSGSSSNDAIDTQQAKEQIRSLLEQGHIFTVTQARLAFAAYLVRVHQRLLRESQAGQGVDALGNELKKDDLGSDAQMDLVLRFLKRAAQNLSQVFRVVVPSKKLSIQDRRRILAKQLADFVSIYSKDTQTISAQEKKGAQPSKIPISDSVFQQFLEVSHENDLEEVLTLFTKINRSASIFLGGIQQLSQQNKDKDKEKANDDSTTATAGGASSHRDSASSSPSKALATQTTSEREKESARGARQSSNSNSTSNSNPPFESSNDRSGRGGGSGSQSKGDYFDSRSKVVTVGVALDATHSNPLSEKLMDMTYTHQSTRRPPSVPVGVGGKGGGRVREWQRDRSVERRDRSVERELVLSESPAANAQKSEGIQTRVAFDANSSSHRSSRLMERSSASRSSLTSSQGGAPFVNSPSPSHSRERATSSYDQTRATVPSASGDVISPTSIATSTSRSVRNNSQSDPSTSLYMSSFSNGATGSSRVSSAKAVSTPMNRSKKPRPYSAQLDAAARIYSENLTKTMVPITMTGHHRSQHHSSSNAQTIYNKSEDAISSALQRLAKRQATRQYSANNASSALSGSKADDVTFDSTPREGSGSPGREVYSRTSPAARWDFEDEHANAHASAYSLVTGVPSSSSYQATPGSTQYQVVQTGAASRGGAVAVVGATQGRMSRPTSGVSSIHSHRNSTAKKTGTQRTAQSSDARHHQGKTHSTVATATSENEVVIPSSGSAASYPSKVSGFEDSPYYTRPTRASSASRRAKVILTNSQLNNR